MLMTHKIHKSQTIIKWIVQLILSLLFLFLAYKAIEHFLGGGSKGTILLMATIAIPIGVTFGVVLGDLKIYTDKKLSVLAVIVAYVLAAISFYVGFVITVFIRTPSVSSSIGKFFIDVAFLSRFTIPPLIGYNLVSYLSRKKTSKKCSSQQEIFSKDI